jgi:hypothetical protein
MKSVFLASCAAACCLTFQVSSADVLSDLDNEYPYSYYSATFDESDTPDSIKFLFDSCAHYGRLSGVYDGNSIVNGYALVVGAILEHKDSKKTYFKSPFVWLKNNPLMIPKLISRNSSKLSNENILFINYLLSSYKTITETPDWKTKFQKIKLLYSQFNNKWDYDTEDAWAKKNGFFMTLGFGDDRKPVIPDYLAWGLAKDWIGNKAFPSVFKIDQNVLYYSKISFENYLASFWYRRWADGSIDIVYSTLKILSAVIPRNFERETASGYGFADTIPAKYSRTGENWEIYPTPSKPVTFALVKEDGKTILKTPWTTAVPVKAKIFDCLPVIDGYVMDGDIDSVLISDSEGVADSMTVKMLVNQSLKPPKPKVDSQKVSNNLQSTISDTIKSSPKKPPRDGLDEFLDDITGGYYTGPSTSENADSVNNGDNNNDVNHTDNVNNNEKKAPIVQNPPDANVDFSKYDGSDPVSTINNLCKAFDQYKHIYKYNPKTNILSSVSSSHIKARIKLSDVNMRVVNSTDGKESIIQFICKDSSKCVECNFEGPYKIFNVGITYRNIAEKIVSEIAKLGKDK